MTSPDTLRKCVELAAWALGQSDQLLTMARLKSLTEKLVDAIEDAKEAA